MTLRCQWRRKDSTLSTELEPYPNSAMLLMHSLPNFNSKNFTQTQPFRRGQNFVKLMPIKPQTQPKCSTLSSAAYSNSPLPITLPPSLPKASPCFQYTFTRRTSGHYLETFTAVRPPPPPRNNKWNASHSTPTVSSIPLSLPSSLHPYLLHYWTAPAVFLLLFL